MRILVASAIRDGGGLFEVRSIKADPVVFFLLRGEFASKGRSNF